MASFSGSLSLEDIEDELNFTEVLINSLDPEADDYQDDLSKHQSTKADLERRLAAMQANPGPASHGNFDMDGASGPQPSGSNWWQVAMNGQPASNHSTGSSASGNQYDQPTFGVGVNGIKRMRAQSSYLDEQGANKRLTPEPSNPMASSSHAGSSERAQAHQRAAEAAIRRQIQIQQADAAFARQLSQSNTSGASHTPTASSSRPGVQTTLNYDGTYQRRPQPVATNSPSTHNHMQPPQMSHTPPQHIKTEPPSAGRQHHLVERPRQPATTIDLTGSDSDDGDDDLTEIAPNRFTPNRRPPPARPNGNMSNGLRPFHPPAPTSMQQPTTMQMPGSFPSAPPPGSYVYGSATPSGVPSTMNRATDSAANGYRSPWLASTMNGIRTAATTLGSQMQELNDLMYGSSRSLPVDLDDDDDDDVVYGGSRRVNGFGNYAGNEDLYRTRYDAFANYDPMRSKEEIEALLQNIRPDEDLPAHLRVTTPFDMNVQLHKYQELGLTWLKKCEEGSNKGGILADDMGLGKTIQMLSLMVERKSEDPLCKTTLIIAPVALMRQWKQEIRDRIKMNRRLSVYTHHGQHKKKSFRELQHYDVVLTTYGSIASELKKVEAYHLRRQADPDARQNPKEKCVLLDENANWYRVVLDEAQCIKNRSTKTAKAACLLRAKYRFCVTGTPMMNNVEELYSLLKFLRIKPYSQWEKFRLDINMPLRSAHEDVKKKAMQLLQALCKAIMLRRTKSSTFEGQPILRLPERTTTIVHPEFDEDERKFYTALETNTQLTFNKYLRRGEVGKSYHAILVLLLRLRQAACHPHLIKDFGISAAADLALEQMLDFAKNLDPAVVARIKEAGGNFECPVCYDVTPTPAIFVPCGHHSCSDCFTRIADPANAIQNGDENGAARCISCRGPIDPKRLTDLVCFNKVHCPELLSKEELERFDPTEDEDDDDGTSESGSDEDDDDEDGDPTLGGFIVHDEQDDYYERNVGQEEGSAGPSKRSTGKGGKKRKSRKGKAKKTKTLTLAQLKAQGSKSQAARKKFLARLRKNFKSSAKIDRAMEILRDIMADRAGEKVLVFSQWTSLLDLLEVPIDEQKWGYRRYDGSLSAAARGDAVDDFRDPQKDVRIMLVSLKAGNAGLNLNMASQVIILDPFWNPYIEEQAIDRAHRLGQLHPVTVHRLLIQETVEDRIIALQEKKRALISEALDEQSASQIGRLGVQELAYLFGVTHDPNQRINYQERTANRHR